MLKNVILTIGDPIAHSLSPKLHNQTYMAQGIDEKFVCIARRVQRENLAGAMEAVRTLDIFGLICTMPHKQEIMALLDELDPAAAKIGAVNTVTNQSNKLKGFNTDWIGIKEALEEKVNLTGKRVAILGAGGTARAACFACLAALAEVTVFNRTLAKAAQIASDFSCPIASLSEVDLIRDHEVIINTTSVGMLTHDEQSPLPAQCLHAGQIVMDVIYVPRETKLLREAQLNGATLIYGTSMFLFQAAEQFKIFTGQKAPKAVMRSILSTLCGVTV